MIWRWLRVIAVYIKVRLQTVIESDGSLGPMVVDHVPPIHLPGREHSPALSVEVCFATL